MPLSKSESSGTAKLRNAQLLLSTEQIRALMIARKQGELAALVKDA